jgi:hypothetical protein
MREFTDTLKEINERLDVPQPARSRLLLEIAGDLNDLYEHFRSQGMSKGDARRLALDTCDLSDDALAELVSLHTSLWRRFMDRFSAQAQSRWERALLLVFLVFVVAATGQIVTTAAVFRLAAGWVWPAVFVTFVGVVVGAEKLYQAYIKKSHNARRLRSGLGAVLAAAVADLIIGTYGYAMGMYHAVHRTAEDVDGMWLFVTEWLLESSSLLIVCFTAAILVSLLWYVLANKVARIEQAEAAVLLID